MWATAKPVGVADGGGDAAVLPLRVLPLTGNLDGVMPSAVMLDGSSPALHAVGFGLQPPTEQGTANDGLTPVPVPRGVNADGSSSGMAPPVACAVGQMAAEVADCVIEVGCRKPNLVDPSAFERFERRLVPYFKKKKKNGFRRLKKTC